MYYAKPQHHFDRLAIDGIRTGIRRAERRLAPQIVERRETGLRGETLSPVFRLEAVHQFDLRAVVGKTETRKSPQS